MPVLRVVGETALSVISERLAAFRARTTKRVYFGWWVSIAGAFNMFVSSGPTFQASSVFFKAIEDEFGWSRALISGVASFGRFGGAMLGPIEGFMTDRFGSGKMVLIGFTLGGAGMIFFSQIQGPLQYYFCVLPAFTWVQHGRLRAVDDIGQLVDDQQPSDGHVDRDRRQQHRRLDGAADCLGCCRIRMATDGDGNRNHRHHSRAIRRVHHR